MLLDPTKELTRLAEEQDARPPWATPAKLQRALREVEDLKRRVFAHWPRGVKPPRFDPEMTRKSREQIARGEGLASEDDLFRALGLEVPE
jgi:hypothetical protein